MQGTGLLLADAPFEGARKLDDVVPTSCPSPFHSRDDVQPLASPVDPCFSSGPAEDVDHPLPNLRLDQLVISRFVPSAMTNRDAKEPRGAALPQAEALAIPTHHLRVRRECRHSMKPNESRCHRRDPSKLLGRVRSSERSLIWPKPSKAPRGSISSFGRSV